MSNFHFEIYFETDRKTQSKKINFDKNRILIQKMNSKQFFVVENLFPEKNFDHKFILESKFLSKLLDHVFSNLSKFVKFDMKVDFDTFRNFDTKLCFVTKIWQKFDFKTFKV